MYFYVAQSLDKCLFLLNIYSQKRILRSANLLKARESSCFIDEDMN